MRKRKTPTKPVSELSLTQWLCGSSALPPAKEGATKVQQYGPYPKIGLARVAVQADCIMIMRSAAESSVWVTLRSMVDIRSKKVSGRKKKPTPQRAATIRKSLILW